MESFSVSDVLNLTKLLNNGNEEEPSQNQFYSGKTESTLNPGNLMGGNNQKKELAKPYAKIEAKINNRTTVKAETKVSNDIWTDDDFKEEKILEDGRPKPEFEILYKQSVKPEDLYLGMSGVSNSSLHCDNLLIKIFLPNTNLKEIALDVKEQSIHISTPNYLLNHILPYKIDKDKTDAKWDKEKGLLLITLKIIKKEIWDQFITQENA
jgi:hypothetical protein